MAEIEAIFSKTANKPLDPLHEQMAERIAELQMEAEDRLGENLPIDDIMLEIRKIGERIAEEGGHWLMLRVGYRAQALGGCLRSLEFSWEGLCGWMA
jgi:hypothetical protein